MSFRRGKSFGNEEEQSRKLFVGGLSFDTTDETLKDYFDTHGTIVDCVVIKDRITQKSKGFGFVTYETEEQADLCMDNRPHELDSRIIDVKRAVSREESTRPGAHVSVKKIFLGGLKDGMKEEDIREYFEKHGSIEQIEIMTERSTGKTRGFGFVTFEDHDTVDKLVSKRIHEIAGNKCEVKKALSKAEIEKAKSDSDMKAQRSTGYDDYGGERSGYGGYGGRGGGGYGRGGSNGYDSYSRPSYGGGAYGDSYDRDGYGGYGGDSYNRYGGGGGGGYGGNDGYGASGGYASDGYGGGSSGYGAGYGAGSSSYGPMKGAGQYSQRSSGPYGGGYGSGAGGSSGGYGSGGYGQGYGGGNYNAGGRY